MITVDYFGRYGNNLFQYLFAKILSWKHSMDVISPPPEGFLKVKIDGCCTTPDLVGKGRVLHRLEDSNYTDGYKSCYEGFHLHGFFQKAEIYNPYRDQIKGCIDLPPIEKNTEDIVIHLRLTDYWWYRNKSVIHPMYYNSILHSERWKKLYIVVEPHKTNYHYLKYFNHIPKKRCEIVSQTPEQDFHFIRKFDRIVCSNSTFAWWAAFLSEASKIWTFKPWMKNKGIELSGMVGAKEMNGTFLRNKALEVVDWWDYWKK